MRLIVEELSAAAAKLVRRSRATSVAIIVTSALGIAAAAVAIAGNYVAFARPLPYADSDRLVVFKVERAIGSTVRRQRLTASPADIDVWTSVGADRFQRVAAAGPATYAVDGDDRIGIAGGVVSDEFFQTMGLPMHIGVPITANNARQPVAVISSSLWTSRFQRQPSALGSSLVLNDVRYSIVGVVDDALDFPLAYQQYPVARTAVWTPLAYTLSLPAADQPASVRGRLELITRLAPGVSLPAIGGAASTVVAELERRTPGRFGNARVLPAAFQATLSEDTRPSLLLILATGILVFAAAVVNAANLLIGRQRAGELEWAVRAALGADPSRRAAAAVAEIVLLVGVGTVIALSLGLGAARQLAALAARLSSTMPLPTSTEIAVATVAVSVVMTVMVTMSLAIGRRPSLTMLAGARGIAAAPASGRFHSVLIVVEIAVAIVVVVNAALFAKNVSALLATNLGANTNDVIAVAMDTTLGRPATPAAQANMAADIVARVSAIPGVASASLGTAMPPNVSVNRAELMVSDANGRRAEVVDINAIEGDYLRTLGIRIVDGHGFGTQPSDADGIVLSEAAARMLFGTAAAVGKALQLPGDTAGTARSVIGIASDVRFHTQEQPVTPIVYRPYAQRPWHALQLLIRHPPSAEITDADIRRTIAAAAPAVTILSVRKLSDIVADTTSVARFRSTVMWIYSLVALALVAGGLYSVTSSCVRDRLPEFGLRLALGAQPHSVLWQALVRSLVPCAVGAVIGCLIAVLLGRVAAFTLFGITMSTSTASFVSAIGITVVVVLAASLVPARRAISLDVLKVLRND